MKLESLKSSKFEAFKQNALINTMGIVGGLECRNTYKSATANLPSDSFTDDTGKIAFTDGSKPMDYHDYICPTGPSEGQGGVIKIV